MTLAEKIKQIREKKGMTQKEVASLMGISQQAYGQYESGGRVPKKLVQKLMKVNHKISEAELRNAVPLYGEDDLRRFIEKVNWEAGEAIRAEEEKKLLEKFRRLNKTGKKVAVERVEELTQIPKYQCKDAAAELKMG